MATLTIDLLVRETPDLTDPVLVTAVAEHADRLQLSLTAARKESAEVRKDPALTHRGVELALPAVAVRAAERLKALEASVRQLATGVERSGAILSTAARHRLPENVDPEDQRWAEREARDRLAGMGELERESLYLASCERCDTASIRAFECGPGLFPLLKLSRATNSPTNGRRCNSRRWR
jgi:hypothetical protein